MKKIIIIGGILAAFISYGFYASFNALSARNIPPNWLGSTVEEVFKYSIFVIIFTAIYKRNHKNLAKKGALFGFVFGVSELAIKLFYFRENQLGLAFGSFLLPIPFLTFLGFLMGCFFSKKYVWVIFTGLTICSVIHWQYNELILWIDKLIN